MEERVNKIKEEIQSIIKNSNLSTISGDSDLMQYLVDLEKREINENEIELIEKTVNNIKAYFYTKEKMLLINDDYNYLKEVANYLRNQSVRVEDNIVFGEPIFKIKEDEKEFITREGAENFINANSTAYSALKTEETEDNGERRKKEIFDVKVNQNNEFAKILEIIKRNF